MASVATADAPCRTLASFVVEDGRVTGVVVDADGVRKRIGASRGVLINAGGFAQNAAMREKYGPQPSSTEWTVSNPGDTGEMIERIGAYSMAPLGASVLAQKAALAGLSVKREWMAEVQAIQRANQETVKRAVDKVSGMSVAVYPSQANFLVIDPDECIDCAVCVAECPVNAIYAEEDTPADQQEFIKLNVELARKWPSITKSKEALADAEAWKDVKDKLQYLQR